MNIIYIWWLTHRSIHIATEQFVRPNYDETKPRE
jgi:hypothetical protein